MLKSLCKAQYLFFKLLKKFDEFSRKFFCTEDPEPETVQYSGDNKIEITI